MIKTWGRWWRPKQHPISQDLKSHIGVRGKRQLEFNFYYPIASLAENTGRKNCRAHVRMEIYPNRAFQISPTMYSKDRFYEGLHSAFRLREPRLAYSDDLNESVTFCSDPAITSDKLRLYACSLLRYFFRKLERREKRLLQTFAKDDAKRIRKSCLNSERFASNVFRLVKLFRVSGLKSNDPEIKKDFRLLDEYLSIALREGILRMSQDVQSYIEVCKQKKLRNQTLKPLLHKLTALIRLERKYARSQGYLWLAGTATDHQRESYVLRKRELRSHAFSSLELETRSQPKTLYRRHLAAFVAAVAAAVWAFFSSYMIWKLINFSGIQFIEALPVSSLALLVAVLAGSYALKDRIKEIFRGWIDARLPGYRADRTSKIIFHSSNGDTCPVADIKENFSLRKHNSTYPPSLATTGPFYLQFDKTLTLLRSGKKVAGQPCRTSIETMRIDLSTMLAKLDRETTQSLLPSESGTAETVILPKVYTFDLKLRTSCLDAELEKLYHIKVNQKEILSIEIMNPAQDPKEPAIEQVPKLIYQH